MSDKPVLISFKLCPFVQRSVITLNHKQIDYEIKYIDLQNKPDWFLELSPLGKVPLLQIENGVLFESAVINEYLDEISPPSLHPKDPFCKAQHRAWIEYGSSLFMDQYQFLSAADDESFAVKQAAFAAKLDRLEEQLGEGPYFEGSDFSLVDTAYAPLFMRMALVEKAGGPALLQGKVRAWSEALLARDDVKRSVVEDFDSLFLDFLGNFEGPLKKLLAKALVAR